MSKPYRLWSDHAHLVVVSQRVGKVEGPYRLTASFTRPDRRPRDLGNLTKALEDVLQKAGVIENDHLAREIHLFWNGDDPVKGGHCAITIEPIGRAG